MSELEIWNELGNIYYNAGAHDEAIRAYHRAIELDRGCGQSFINLADIYIRKEYFAEAILMYQKGIGLLKSPGDKADLWNRLGEIYLQQNRYEEAWEAFRNAAQLEPDNEVFQEGLAKVSLSGDHPALAPDSREGIIETALPIEEPVMEEEATSIQSIVDAGEMDEILPNSEHLIAEPIFSEEEAELLPAAEAVMELDAVTDVETPAEDHLESLVEIEPVAEMEVTEALEWESESSGEAKAEETDIEALIALLREPAMENVNETEEIPPLPDEFRMEKDGEIELSGGQTEAPESEVEAEAALKMAALLADLPEADIEQTEPAIVEPASEITESACWIFQKMGETHLEEAESDETLEKEPVVLGNRVLSEEAEFTPLTEIPEKTDQPVMEEAGPAEAIAEEAMALPKVEPFLMDELTSEEETLLEVENKVGDDPAEAKEPVAEEDRLHTLEKETTAEADEDIDKILASALPDQFEIPFQREEAKRELPFIEPKMAEPMRSRARALVKVGLKHWHQDDYEGAMQFFDTALNLAGVFFDYSFEALCYHAMGLVKRDMGNVDEAIGAYENAACLDPVNFSPWKDIGYLYSRSNRYEAALGAFKKAIEHDPHDSLSWNGLGDVYHKLGRTEDAISAYQLGNVFDQAKSHKTGQGAQPKLFENGEETARVMEEMGNIHYLNSDYDEAIHAYTDTLELLEAPNDQARLWRRLGDAYQRLNEDDNAKAAYRKAIELDAGAKPIQETSENEPAGASLPAENSKEEYKVEATQAVADEAEAEPAIAVEEIHEDEEAERILTFAVDRHSHFIEDEPAEEKGPFIPVQETEVEAEAEAAYWLLKSDTQAKGMERGSDGYKPANDGSIGAVRPSPAFVLPKYSRQAKLDKPLLPEAYEDPAVMVMEEEAGEDSAELESFETSILLDEETRPMAKNELEDLQEEALEAAEATVGEKTASVEEAAEDNRTNLHTLESDIAAYRRVTEINPLNDRAWDALGNMYEATGLHSEAIAAFEKAVSLASQREVYHYHLGLAYAAQKHYDKAIQSLQKVVALNPNYVLAHCALAGYYRRTGKEAEAREHMIIARPYMEKENYYNQACFESICGNTDRALNLLKNAVENKQVETEMARSDPDLDFIREDARFEALLNRKEAEVPVV